MPSEKKMVVERPTKWCPDFLDGGLIGWKVETDVDLLGDEILETKLVHWRLLMETWGPPASHPKGLSCH